MKVDVVAKGAGGYVVGKVEKFDQKNEIFKRGWWDLSQLISGRRRYQEKRDFAKFFAKNKPGFTQQDTAFMDAAWLLEIDFAKGNSGGNYGLFSGKPRNLAGLNGQPALK